MDLFTQNMINRTKLRQEQLTKTKQTSGLSLLCGNQDEGGKPSSSESSNLDKEEVFIQKAFEVKENAVSGKENLTGPNSSKVAHGHVESSQHDETSPVKTFRKNRLEALADRINDWEDESRLGLKPVTSTPEKIAQSVSTPSKYGSRKPTKSASANVQLESSVGSNQMSNETRFTTKKSKVSFGLHPIPKVQDSKVSELEEVASPIKSVILDKSILQSLEFQGYTPTESRSRLIFEFEKEQENEVEEETARSWTFTASPRDVPSPVKNRVLRTPKPENTPSVFKKNNSSSNQAFAREQPSRSTNGFSPRLAKPGYVAQNVGKDLKSSGFPNSPKTPEPVKLKKPENRTLSVQELAAQFDSPRSIPKDPTEMTILERKALFERNRTIESHSNSKIRSSKASCSRQSPSNFSKPGANVNFNAGTKDKPATFNVVLGQTVEETQNKEISNSLQSNVNSSTQGTNDIQLMSSPSVANMRKLISDRSPLNTNVEQKKSSSGVELYDGIHQVRPIRVSPPKPGKLYPCLSDIESVTENESDADDNHESDLHSHNDDEVNEYQDLDSSFAIEILGRAGLSQFINTPKRKLQEMQPEIKENVFNEDVSEISNLLDEALDGSVQSVSPKHQKREGCDQFQQESESFAYHSVTSYRQQKEKICTPVKQIVRNREIPHEVMTDDSNVSSGSCDEASIQQQIRSLQEEITTQQNVMAQACQALNLCRATTEFSGSTEQVEGEKLLLISSQKRNAAIEEIQKLKSEAAMKVVKNVLVSRGTLSFSNIGLPLKKEFLAMLPRGGGEIVHYFIVLIRNRGQVIPLQMLSTVDGIQDGVLLFPNLVQLSNLSADFDVAIEVYALQTRKEKLNHEAKYHIRKESSKMRLTPKKLANKQQDRGSSKMSNSAGSSVNLRGSSFGLVGVSNITPLTLRKRSWTLENVPSTSPIDGKLQLKIQSHSQSLIKERGFLTVFEDVGGFGAWHRRWCLLSNDQLLFWKYPDDERLKEPQYVINLRKCITDHVDVVSNDICARPNTFLLVTVRSPENNDKDSLVMTRYSQSTAVRHLISADLKGERQLWCAQINRVLANLRIWDAETE